MPAQRKGEDLTCVNNLVQSNFLTMDSDKKLGMWNVGTGIETSFNQIVDIFKKHLGTRIKPKYLQNPIKNHIYRTLADISLATKELGCSSKWTLDNGVRQLVKLYEKSKLFAGHET
jgi:nucleoside-diphosphate-sugar epimerase